MTHRREQWLIPTGTSIADGQKWPRLEFQAPLATSAPPDVQEGRADGITLCDVILHSLGAVGRRNLAEPALLGAGDPSCRLI